MPRKTETVIEHAARLHNAKLDTEVIAERMGVAQTTVNGYISRARAAGLLEGPIGGNMGHLLRSLPPEVRVWLTRQIPPGSSMAEIIGAIITDAYYEENHVAYPDTGM